MYISEETFAWEPQGLIYASEWCNIKLTGSRIIYTKILWSFWYIHTHICIYVRLLLYSICNKGDRVTESFITVWVIGLYSKEIFWYKIQFYVASVSHMLLMKTVQTYALIFWLHISLQFIIIVTEWSFIRKWDKSYG